MRKTCFFLIILVALVMGCAAISQGASTTMTNNDYCVYPLYARNAVKPYILLLMDFSGSMQFPVKSAQPRTLNPEKVEHQIR